nr:hypothetical protein [Tanacetum cinerariifolium]
MDLYHSQLTHDDLNKLIIKYKIPHDLHPRLISKEIVMFELSDDAIGVYHRMGPLGLNKVVTFEVLCRSLQNQEDVHRLSVHVIKLRDMLEGVLVLSDLSRVWKSQTCDPVLRGTDRNVIGIHDFLCLFEWTGAEVQEEPHHDDLAACTLIAKVLAKDDSLKKRKYGSLYVNTSF